MKKDGPARRARQQVRLFLFQIVFLFKEKYGTLGQVRINTTKFGARYTLLYFLSFCLNVFVLRIQTKTFK